MSDFNVDPDTSVLSNNAIALFGPKPYPGCNPQQCFKVVCYIDVSSFILCINDTLGMEEGDKALKYYAWKIDTILKQMVKSEWKPNDENRKLYGTTHRVGGYGYKFVILITGVLEANDHKQVPNEIYDKLKNDEDGLASIKYEMGNVFTFLRAGFCWCKMNDSMKDIDSMIRLAEIEQDKVKEDLGIGIYDSKSLEAIHPCRRKIKCFRLD